MIERLGKLRKGKTERIEKWSNERMEINLVSSGADR